jgi:hypothetical protein
MRLGNIQIVEDRQHVAAEPLHRIGTWRHAGFAVAAPVVTDNAKHLRERLHLRLPHLHGRAQRIRQHQRRPAVTAFDGNIEQAAVGVDHRHGVFPRHARARPAHPSKKILFKKMDCRVKPGNDIY